MRFLAFLFKFSLLVTFIIGGSFFYLKNEYHTPFSEAEAIVTLPKGTSVRQIAHILYTQGLVSEVIRDSLPYILRLMGQSQSLKAGEYSIPASSTPQQIIALLVSGKSLLHKITFPEGETVFMALERIRQNPLLTGTITLTPQEGQLEPNSFLVSRGMSRDSLIQKMRLAQKKNLDQAWLKRPKDLPIDNQLDFLTLASIIEKETALSSEREKVASVFINRLRKKMRLQTDPTIIYGITKGRKKLGRPIYRSDIQKDTGYNTYQIDGLPPTPICNPSKASLEAIVTAPPTDYLFFVADGTGGHHFSKSFSEHQHYVQKWRLLEKQKRQEEAGVR